MCEQYEIILKIKRLLHQFFFIHYFTVTLTQRFFVFCPEKETCVYVFFFEISLVGMAYVTSSYNFSHGWLVLFLNLTDFDRTTEFKQF